MSTNRFLHVTCACTVLLLIKVSPTWADEMPAWMKDRTNQAMQSQLPAPQVPQLDKTTEGMLNDRTRQALDAASKASRSGLPQVPTPLPLKPAQKATSGFEPETLARRFAQASDMAPSKEQKSAPLIFISLSMPNASLQHLAQDAARLGSPLVLRGLVDGSLNKTTQALAPFSKFGAEIIIHPQAFEQYGVKVVPTFVVDPQQDRILPQSGCAQGQNSCNTLPRVEGDVSLAFALRQMNRISPRPELTQWIDILERRQP